MTPHRGFIALVLFGALAATDARHAAPAATSTTIDAVPDDLFATPARPQRNVVIPAAPRPLAQTGNPLWGISLSSLTATRDRPLFSASRRPPPRAVVAPPAPVAIVVTPTKEPDPLPPPLALIGSIVGDSDAIGVFLDTSTQQVLRLRRGDSHAGWELVSVLQREVTLQRDSRTETLSLRRTEAPGSSMMPPLSSSVPGVGMSPGGGLVPGLVPGVGPTSGASYAPYTPRSTPKNGESDGL